MIMDKLDKDTLKEVLHSLLCGYSNTELTIGRLEGWINKRYIHKSELLPVFECDNCGDIKFKEEEVKCWKCGKGDMVFKGKIKRPVDKERIVKLIKKKKPILIWSDTAIDKFAEVIIQEIER